MVNSQDLIDDAKCYQTIRDMRRPDGVTCPLSSSFFFLSYFGPSRLS